MFNKEARLIKTYIRKKGTNTVTKTGTFEKNASGSDYNNFALPTNTKITSIYIGKISGYYSGSYGEGDYSGSFSQLNISLYNTKPSNSVWSISSAKGNRTYSPNIAALYFRIGRTRDSTDTSVSWSTYVKITYEYTETENYNYVVKY